MAVCIPVGSTWLWELIWPCALNVLPRDLGICVYMGLCLPWSPDKTAGCPLPFPGRCVSVVKTCAGRSHSHYILASGNICLAHNS